MSAKAKDVKTVIAETSAQKTETKPERDQRYIKKYIESAKLLRIDHLNRIEARYPEILKLVLEHLDHNNILFEVLTIGSFNNDKPDASDEKSRLEIIQYWVNQVPVLVNKRTKIGISPLHMAAAHGYLSIFKYLLSQGAKTSKHVREGVFARMNEERFAVQYDRQNIKDYINKMNKVFSLTRDEDVKGLKETINQDKTLLFLRDENGNNLLHLSLRDDNHNVELAKTLIQLGLDVEHSKNDHGHSALQEALLREQWEWIVEVLQYLQQTKKIEAKKINEVLAQLVEMAEKHFSEKNPENTYLRVHYNVFAKINKEYWVIFANKVMEHDAFFTKLESYQKLIHLHFEQHTRNMIALSQAITYLKLNMQKTKDGTPSFTLHENTPPFSPQFSFSQYAAKLGNPVYSGKRARSEENESAAQDPRQAKKARGEDSKPVGTKEEKKTPKQADTGAGAGAKKA